MPEARAIPQRPRPPLAVPTLAMVDAFVGGVAVVLILTILSANNQTTPDRVPRADIVLTCAGDAVTLPDMVDPVAFDALPDSLGALAPSTALSWRVLVRAEADDLGCWLRVQRVLEDANTALTRQTGPAPRPVFLTDVAFIEAAE